jgi:hypothetical protein
MENPRELLGPGESVRSRREEVGRDG